VAQPNILIIDADSRSSRILEVSLKQSGFATSHAKNGVDGLDMLLAGTPALVLVDARLPKLDGYSVVRKMKETPSLRAIPVIMLIPQGSVEDRIRGLELGIEDFLAKPVFVRELLARVKVLLARKSQEQFLHAQLDSRSRFEGNSEELGLVDLLQTFEMARKSGILTLTSGAMRARIYVREGKLVEAELGALRGEEAVYRALIWRKLDFAVEFGPVTQDDRIGTTTQAILMEGLRRMDEWAKLAEAMPPLESVLSLRTNELSERLPEIPDELNGILRLIDGRRTIWEVVDESPFEDLSTLGTLARLYFEGLLEARDGGGPRSGRPNAAEVDGLAMALTESQRLPSNTSPLSTPTPGRTESNDGFEAPPRKLGTKTPPLGSRRPNPLEPLEGAEPTPLSPGVMIRDLDAAGLPPSLRTVPSEPQRMQSASTAAVPETTLVSKLAPAVPVEGPAVATSALAQASKGGASNTEEVSQAQGREKAPETVAAEAASPPTSAKTPVDESEWVERGERLLRDEDDEIDTGMVRNELMPATDPAELRPVRAKGEDDVDFASVPGRVSGKKTVAYFLGTVLVCGGLIIGARKMVRGAHDTPGENSLPPLMRSSTAGTSSLIAMTASTAPSTAPVVSGAGAAVATPSTSGSPSDGPSSPGPSSTAETPGSMNLAVGSATTDPSARTSASAPANALEPATPGDKKPARNYGTSIDDAQEALEKRNPVRAAEIAGRAARQNPGNAEAWLTLGAALDSAGMRKQAKEAYRNCVNQASGPRVTECRSLAGMPVESAPAPSAAE
jgi:DNA-binding response OmpR family regulator